MIKKIKVNTPNQVVDYISVKIDGECNHNGATIEMIEYSKDSFSNDAHMYMPDDSEVLATLVCNCGFEEVQEIDEEQYYEMED